MTVRKGSEFVVGIRMEYVTKAKYRGKEGQTEKIICDYLKYQMNMRTVPNEPNF